MQHLVDAYHLAVDGPAFVLKRPRLWRLLAGLSCLAVAWTVLAAGAGLPWNRAVLGDAPLVAAMLLLVGACIAWRAWRSDLLRVQEVHFTPSALHLAWSHVPTLWGARVRRQQAFDWDELVAWEWVEGDDEHEIKQYLLVELRTPLGLNTRQLRVLVCHGRRVLHCQQLLAFLPERTRVPAWLEAARARASTQAHAFDE